MFYFVVHHFRWLARVPGLPHFFDALLLAGTGLFCRSRLAAMEMLEAEVLRLTDIGLTVHRFGGVEFVEKTGRELGHLHGHGLLDVAVGTQAAAALIARGLVRSHHVFPRSKWVSFQMESIQDVPFALKLLDTARLRELNPSGCLDASPARVRCGDRESATSARRTRRCR